MEMSLLRESMDNIVFIMLKWNSCERIIDLFKDQVSHAKVSANVISESGYGCGAMESN